MHRQYFFQSTLIFLTFPYPEFSEVTWGWATGGGLYLSFLHVEAVLDILRDVSLYAGHVPTLSQPGKVGPEGLATNIASNLPVDTVSEAVLL